MAFVYMIRHGRPSGAWGRSADPDPGLDEMGRAQAKAAADTLLKLPQPPSRAVSSPLRRCRETAAPYAAALGVEVEIDAAFGEIPTPAAVSPDDRSAWLQQAFEGDWRDIQGDLDYEAWRRQVAGALLTRPDTAVFSHFVAINAAVSMVRGTNAVLAFRPDHASITAFRVEGGGLSLVDGGREAETQVL